MMPGLRAIFWVLPPAPSLSISLCKQSKRQISGAINGAAAMLGRLGIDLGAIDIITATEARRVAPALVL